MLTDTRAAGAAAAAAVEDDEDASAASAAGDDNDDHPAAAAAEAEGSLCSCRLDICRFKAAAAAAAKLHGGIWKAQGAARREHLRREKKWHLDSAASSRLQDKLSMNPGLIDYPNANIVVQT